MEIEIFYGNFPARQELALIAIFAIIIPLAAVLWQTFSGKANGIGKAFQVGAMVNVILTIPFLLVNAIGLSEQCMGVSLALHLAGELYLFGAILIVGLWKNRLFIGGIVIFAAVFGYGLAITQPPLQLIIGGTIGAPADIFYGLIFPYLYRFGIHVDRKNSLDMQDKFQKYFWMVMAAGIIHSLQTFLSTILLAFDLGALAQTIVLATFVLTYPLILTFIFIRNKYEANGAFFTAYRSASDVWILITISVVVVAISSIPLLILKVFNK